MSQSTQSYLCSSCDHVGDEVPVSRCVHQSHHFRVCLKLCHPHVHGHPPETKTHSELCASRKYTYELRHKNQ